MSVPKMPNFTGRGDHSATPATTKSVGHAATKAPTSMPGHSATAGGVQSPVNKGKGMLGRKMSRGRR